MRHRVRTRRLGVTTPHRKSMMRNMVTSLLEHGRIVTTITRAKELRRLADRMVTLGKDGSLHARRQALSVIRDKKVVVKLFDDWAPKFADRNGGYTRIVRLAPRRGDATMMAVIELAVDSLKPSKKKAKGVKTEVAPTVESVIPSATEESSEAKESAVEEVAAAETTEETLEAEADEDVTADSQVEGTEEADDTASQTADTDDADEKSADQQK